MQETRSTPRDLRPRATRLPFARSVAFNQGLPVEESLRLAEREGCTHFYIEGSSPADCASAWDAKRLDEFDARMRERDLRPIFHGNYKNPLSHWGEEIRQAAVRFAWQEIDVAARLSAPLIVHGSSIFAHTRPRECRREAFAAFVRSIEGLERYAARRGVALWLENLENYRNRHPFQTIFSQLSEYEELLGRLSGVSFLLDLGHENITSGDPGGVFARLSERIVALSFSDNRGNDDAHAPLGRGTIDFLTVLRRIREAGWQGHLTFESRGTDLAEGVAFLERLQASLEAAEPAVC